MRRFHAFATICFALVLPGAALAETLSKPLRNAVPTKPGQAVVLENLAGSLEVVAADGTEAVLTGTVYADAGSPSESQRLLEAVGVEVEAGTSGQTLHVSYPVDRSPFRYRLQKNGRSFWSHSSSTVDYQGRRVTVTEGGGSNPLLYADLRLEIPAGVAVYVTNHLGRVTVRGVGSDIEVKTAAADVAADDVAGRLKVKTGSGDTRVKGSAGLAVSTGSGDVVAASVRGDVGISTGSGDVALDDVAGSLEVQTGSGDIEGRALREVERLQVETGSGQVTLSLDAAKLAGGEVGAASGDVDLSLASATALTLSVSTASGDIDTGGLAVTRVAKRTERRLEAEVKGGGAPLRIHTASGDVRLR